MSFLSFLSYFLPTPFVSGNTDEHEDVTTMDQSDKFPQFVGLPAELRHMIIKEAIYDHEESIHRVVFLDPLACRISPTKELAAMPSPLLFVNTEFRTLALEVYVKIDVFGLGAPLDDQYGDESDWYIVPERREYLFYSHDFGEQIHEEVDDDGVPKGCLYINPEKDTFVTGIHPRQVALTSMYRSLPNGPNPPWRIPRDFVTDQLQEETCAKIITIRELEWDLDDRCLSCGTCLLCGLSRRPCCTDNFFDFDERGAEWEPLFRGDVFTGVETFGFYLMVSPDDMQEFFSDFVLMGGKKCLEEEWQRRYVEFDLTRLGE